jgi:alkylhydroperoxidase family enzyme
MAEGRYRVTTGATKELLDLVQQTSGRIPNMVRLMANSQAALGAYMNFAGAFRNATLPAKVRDLIAVTVAETAGCDYSSGKEPCHGEWLCCGCRSMG